MKAENGARFEFEAKEESRSVEDGWRDKQFFISENRLFIF